MISAFLTEIKEAVYLRTRKHGMEETPVLFALDEVSNIAALPDLPQMVSEGRGNGLVVMAVFQDLSQARVQWPGYDFVSLFPEKVIFRGVADADTLERLSLLLGEYYQPTYQVSYGQQPSTTASSQQVRTLSPAAIATVPKGATLTICPDGWNLSVIAHHYWVWPFNEIIDNPYHAGAIEVDDLTDSELRSWPALD